MGKFIKLWESWSSDYTHEFSDLDFELIEVGNRLTGKKTGVFVMADINDYYNELIARLDSEYEVIRQKSNFNLESGQADFEVRVREIGKNSKKFTVTDNGVQRELSLLSISDFSLSPFAQNVEEQCVLIYLAVNCYNVDLGNVTFTISCDIRFFNTNPSVEFYLGRRCRGIDFSLEQYKRFKELVVDLDWAGYDGDQVDKVLGVVDFDWSLDKILAAKGRYVRGRGWQVNL
jgi:hypothetical protein